MQENIARFGGNPSKVTIFGESAGATSTDTLITSWPHNPPFHAAILESGQSTLPIVTDIGVNSTESWVKLVTALNCSQARSNLDCVRAASASSIQNIIEHGPLSFRPVFDNVTLVVNATAARAAHNIANVPIMAGTNGQEGRAFVYGQNNLTAFFQSIPGMTPALKSALLAAYPIGTLGISNDFEIIAQIYTDYLVGCVCHTT